MSVIYILIKKFGTDMIVCSKSPSEINVRNLILDIQLWSFTSPIY